MNLPLWFIFGIVFRPQISTFSGQTFVVIAISAHSPSVYALCATAEIPLSFVWGRTWLGQRLTDFHLLGGGLIIAGIVVVVSCPSVSCRVASWNVVSRSRQALVENSTGR